MFDGWHPSDPLGTPGAGGTTPPSVGGSDNPSINFDGYISGYYFFTYSKPDPCGGSVQIVVPVVGTGDAGETATIQLCTTDAPINLWTQIGANIPASSNNLPPVAEWSGSGVGSAGYDNNSTASDPTDDVFDPSAVTPGTYVFTMTISPDPPDGYSLDGSGDCPDCQPTQATLTIEVVNDFNPGTPINLAVCN